MHKLGLIVPCLVLLLATPAMAQPPGFMTIAQLTPDADRGGELYNQRCVGCHGPNGNATIPTFPRLAGQLRFYELVQLWALRGGQRPSDIMNPIAADLTDQDIADITAWVSAQTPDGAAWEGQDQALVEQGAEIFARGNHESGVIACAVCHGMSGEGVEQLLVNPRIMGQSPGYLKQAILFFANLPDIGVGSASAMTINVSRLTEQEIDAVVAFLASRPWGDGP